MVNLSLEFNYYSLGDLVKIKYGKNQKKVQDDENGKYPIYGTGGLMGYSIDYLYDKPSVLIGRKGSIEKVRYIEEPFWTVDTLFYTEVNDKIVIPKFLYYVMSLINLSRYNEGTSIPSLRTETLNRLDLPIPNLDYQKRVLTVLSNIDKKISLNKKINKNLEDTILKIFDSWFVKFELSNEFSDSKLGLIPKGWKIDYLGSKKSCSIIRSGIDEFDNSKIYVATADVDNSIITSNDTLITMNDKPSRANMQPIAKSIWFAKMIDSRKLIMIDDYCSDLLNNYIFSTGFCGLKCVDKYFYYLWAFLLTDAFDVMKNNFCTGTTMQAINNKDTKLIEFVLPDDNIINQFNVIAKPMFKKIYYNSLEIKKLQKLRDTLLPKLMSGEIDVSKINCDLELICKLTLFTHKYPNQLCKHKLIHLNLKSLRKSKNTAFKVDFGQFLFYN